MARSFARCIASKIIDTFREPCQATRRRSISTSTDVALSLLVSTHPRAPLSSSPTSLLTASPSPAPLNSVRWPDPNAQAAASSVHEHMSSLFPPPHPAHSFFVGPTVINIHTRMPSRNQCTHLQHTHTHTSHGSHTPRRRRAWRVRILQNMKSCGLLACDMSRNPHDFIFWRIRYVVCASRSETAACLPLAP